MEEASQSRPADDRPGSCSQSTRRCWRKHFRRCMRCMGPLLRRTCKHHSTLGKVLMHDLPPLATFKARRSGHLELLDLRRGEGKALHLKLLASCSKGAKRLALERRFRISSAICFIKGVSFVSFEISGASAMAGEATAVWAVGGVEAMDLAGAGSWVCGDSTTGTAWRRCFSGEVRRLWGERGVGTERSSGMMLVEGPRDAVGWGNGSFEIFLSSSSKTARRCEGRRSSTMDRSFEALFSTTSLASTRAASCRTVLSESSIKGSVKVATAGKNLWNASG